MTQSERPIITVGFSDDSAEGLRDAVAALGFSVAAVARCEDAVDVIAGVQPLAIVLRDGAPGAAQACAQIRAQSRLLLVPVIGVAAEANDLSFAELFSWGGDDLVEAAPSFRALVRRLRPLLSQTQTPSSGATKAVPEKPADPPRNAVVAGSDATWRTLMGRALYNGGFAVRFAVNGESVATECARPDVRVVVAMDDLHPDGAGAALGRARAAGSNVPWVLVAPPKRMAAAHAVAKAQKGASVADGFAPHENVLFLVNELLAARGVDKRASPRLLYGTTVAFRLAGREEDDIGFSYNVSAGGIFVRTTAAPDAGQEVWLEMWSPRAERRVRLAGKVAWRRPFGPVGVATVPAGFGVQITDGLAGDMDRWRDGNVALAARLLGA